MAIVQILGQTIRVQNLAQYALHLCGALASKGQWFGGV